MRSARRTTSRIGGDGDGMARAGLARRPLERLRGRVEIARTVIDDRDKAHRERGSANSAMPVSVTGSGARGKGATGFGSA